MLSGLPPGEIRSVAQPAIYLLAPLLFLAPPLIAFAIRICLHLMLVLPVFPFLLCKRANLDIHHLILVSVQKYRQLPLGGVIDDFPDGKAHFRLPGLAQSPINLVSGHSNSDTTA